MDKDKMPKLAKVMLERGFLMLPLIAIITILALGFTPTMAALIGIVTAIIGSYLRTMAELLCVLVRGRKAYGMIANGEGVPPETSYGKALLTAVRKTGGLHGKDYLKALEGGARSIIGVALACGTAGIIAGMITKTGIGLKMGTGLSSLASGNLLLLLLFTMFASILLGMGVPTTANYLITSTIMAPIVFKALTTSLPEAYGALAAINEGYALLPAHLFTFYFGIIADITPPVALAAMAGAAIAKSDPLKTGLDASRLAIAAFLVPYLFVLSPQMLMLNARWYEVVQIVITSLVGMFGIGMGLEKFWKSKLNILQAIIAVAGGLALVYPGTLTDAIGIVLVGLVVVSQLIQNKKARA